jgi:hypothetical protein
MAKIIRHIRKSLGTSQLRLCSGGVSRVDSGFAIRIRANQKSAYFSSAKPGPALARSGRVFPLYGARLHIAVIGNFIFIVIRTAAAWRARAIEAAVNETYPQNPQERGPGAKDLSRGQLEDSSMTFRPNEAAIDEIVASCNGDVHGALKALLLVNERLEAELQQLYAAVALGGPFQRGSNALH